MPRVGWEAELEQDRGGRRMASKAEKKLVQRSVKDMMIGELQKLGWQTKSGLDETRIGRIKQ